MRALRTELRNAVRRGKRLVRWLTGDELLQGRQINVPCVHLGSDYGGWTAAADRLNEGSIVYSFGVGRDVTFDVDLIERYGLTVHAFDPTPRSINWLERQSLPEEFIFHPYGISDTDGEIVFHAPAHDTYVSYSAFDEKTSGGSDITAQVYRLRTIMDDLGDKRVDLLKMDIEGAEYAVIDDLISAEIYPEQLLVEFHHRRSSITVQQTRDAIDHLNQAGYKIFHVSPKGQEYSFVRVPCA